MDATGSRRTYALRKEYGGMTRVTTGGSSTALGAMDVDCCRGRSLCLPYARFRAQTKGASPEKYMGEE